MAFLLISLIPAWGQVRYGLKAGIVSSDTTDFRTTTGTGFMFGGTCTSQFSDRFAFQWEVLISKRGGSEHGIPLPGGEGGPVPDRDPALTYVELPLSFRYRFGGTDGWHSILYGGAFYSLKINGDMVWPAAKSSDAGLLAGWELGRTSASGRTWYLDIRFASGLVDTVEDHDSKSRSIFGTVGVRF